MADKNAPQRFRVFTVIRFTVFTVIPRFEAYVIGPGSSPGLDGRMLKSLMVGIISINRFLLQAYHHGFGVKVPSGCNSNNRCSRRRDHPGRLMADESPKLSELQESLAGVVFDVTPEQVHLLAELPDPATKRVEQRPVVEF